MSKKKESGLFLALAISYLDKGGFSDIDGRCCDILHVDVGTAYIYKRRCRCLSEGLTRTVTS